MEDNIFGIIQIAEPFNLLSLIDALLIDPIQLAQLIDADCSKTGEELTLIKIAK